MSWLVIRIARPSAVPVKLATDGQVEIVALCRDYDASPADYDTGHKKFKFKSGIYGHRTVKQALIAAQNDKCCFCESRVTHVAHGDVEHFRPKAGYQQDSKDVLHRPGYYWLAYEWSNLLFSCQICNQTRKRNVFPLANPAGRAHSHHDDVSRERPLLIDPTQEDPTESIGFRSEVAFPRNGRRKAKATIDIAALNRPDLLENRSERLRLLDLLAKEWRLLNQMIESAVENNDPHGTELVLQRDIIEWELRRAIQPTAEFSAMAKDLLQPHFP